MIFMGDEKQEEAVKEEERMTGTQKEEEDNNRRKKNVVHSEPKQMRFVAIYLYIICAVLLYLLCSLINKLHSYLDSPYGLEGQRA